MPVEIRHGLGLRKSYFQAGREDMVFVLADAGVQICAMAELFLSTEMPISRSCYFTLFFNSPDGQVGNWYVKTGGNYSVTPVFNRPDRGVRK